MADRITGGCMCGRVRYRANRLDAKGFRCFCRDCQHLTGAGHSEMFPVTRECFEITGEIGEFEMKGSSGGKTWSVFCKKCGSPLTRRSEKMNDRLYLHAGSMDEPTKHNPENSIYAEKAQPWDVL